MPFIVTPSQLSQRAELYHQLGSMLSAGVTLIQGLEQIRRNPPSPAYIKPVTELIFHLQAGHTFTGAMVQIGEWMPAFDIALLQAGEQSGRLDACFKLLAGYYREQAELIRGIISRMIYPTLLLHFAILIFPTSLLVDLVLHGKVLPFLFFKLVLLIPIYAVFLFSIFASKANRGEQWRFRLEALVDHIPLIGTARKQIALARFAAALEALISAGVSAIGALELAATASGSAMLKRAVIGWRPLLEGGETPARLMSTSPVFPDFFANLYNTGEITGQQDETLRRLYVYYHEEGSQKFKLAARAMTGLIFAGITILVALQVIAFWAGYFQQINQLAE